MIRLGIIGTGGMANAHARAFGAMRGVAITACCDVNRARAEAFATRYAIPKVYDDYTALLDDGRVDAVASVTPDSVHAEVAIAAARRKIHILSEKPLAGNLPDARAMAEAVEKAGVINMVNFSYRNSAALQRASRAVASGQIGRVMHVESSYLQSWLAQDAWGDWRTSDTWLWRLSTAHGSLGVLGDVGCHIYDMTALLAGDIGEIACRLQTFDKGLGSVHVGPYVLDANDSFVSTVGFVNGAVGTIHSSRWASGHHNSLRVRVYGDEGAVEVDLDHSYSEYRICRGKANLRKAVWRTVTCAPTPTNYQRFIKAVRTGAPDPSDFANGVKIQAYLHGSLESASLDSRPVRILL
ncbi:MAG: Gfo/Idh/MocA family oxidoreductase [Planctomycetes bacterium]|nr:Gfo/Idh/MocA family oxidoreductase [Planctomycetota bacterium]